MLSSHHATQHTASARSTARTWLAACTPAMLRVPVLWGSAVGKAPPLLRHRLGLAVFPPALPPSSPPALPPPSPPALPPPSPPALPPSAACSKDSDCLNGEVCECNYADLPSRKLLFASAIIPTE